MPIPVGTLLNNRYRIVSILGQGGMGAVYRASDEHLLIPVAVKENLFLTEEYGRQFQREAHILAGLRHNNLPHVTDYFALEHQGQYLVMDFIEGEDLRQRMERMGALPERETILIGICICDALTYLHTRRPPIVHRDIKPGNIKVTADGQAVLVDFGLAKILQSGQATSTGARAMTPGYSPPEQYGTARTDDRSDIYSLGATLYAALTGIIPEDGLARMTGKASLTPIRELVPKINRRLADSIEKALEVEPEHRFQTAEEFKDVLIESGELSSYYQERPVISPPPEGSLPSEPGDEPNHPILSAPIRKSQPGKRKKKVQPAWVFAPILLLLTAVLFSIFWFRQDLTKSVLAYFGSDPTSTSRPTEISAIGTGVATQPSILPTQTTNASQVDLTSTTAPTLEPTGVLTPVSDETLVPSPTPTGGGAGQIAFASDRTGVMQIWVVSADPLNPSPRQITNLQEGACQPSWSPDGTRLAFTSPCLAKQDTYPGAGIYIIDLNKPEDAPTKVIASLEGDFDPAWSPDGKRIAFTSLRNQIPAIYVINLNDLSFQKLSPTSKPDKQPSWSPSGTQIAFVRQFLSSQIWIMMDNGQFQSQFSPLGPLNNLWPSWSVDGQVIFYSQSNQEKFTPWLVYRRYEDREKSIETRIPATSLGENGPFAQVRPSSDGSLLAYESWPDGTNHDIYIMNANGSNPQRLTTDPGDDFGPAWRPVIPLQQP
jgi:eukaryotic-like serine/threonine-protein kinase